MVITLQMLWGGVPGLQQVFNKCLPLLEFLEIEGNISSEVPLNHNKDLGTGFYVLLEESGPTTLDISLGQTLKGWDTWVAQLLPLA